MLNELKHPQRERLKHLDTLLFWEGEATRRDLMERFGISTAQAAIDFREYLGAEAPGKPTYNAKRKAYVAPHDFAPLFEPTPPDQYLAECGEDKGWYDRVPNLDRSQDTALYARLHRALKANKLVEICYQSMSESSPRIRRIAPTRFVHDGMRLHVRAWCEFRKSYRDFLPSRIVEAQTSWATQAAENIPTDEDWQTWAHIWLVVKPGLSAGQATAVEREFGLINGQKIVSVRKALEFYLSRRWNLGTASSRLEISDIQYEPMDGQANDPPYKY